MTTDDHGSPPSVDESERLEQISAENCQLMAECHRLSRENNQFQALLRNASEAIVVLSPTGEVQSFNRAAEKMFGFRERDMMGKSLDRLIPCPEHNGNVGTYVKEFAAKHQDSASTPPLPGQRWDGTELHLRAAFGEVHSNTELWDNKGSPAVSEFVLCMFRNVTEEIKLEQRLRENTRQLELKNYELREANDAKDEFLANMSHELRTPLHGILSFARFGMKKWETADRAKLSDYFQTIETSGRSLLNLVNDLLDLAKLEAGKMSFDIRSVNLGNCVTEVLHELSPLMKESKISCDWDPRDVDLDIPGDENRMKQVIRNILSNAIRYSPRGGKITIEPSCNYGHSRITVRDTGPGIPTDEIETVFEKFVQSSTTKSGAGGTGLGLPICRQILTTHAGRIWAEESDTGGVVAFEVPTSQHLKAVLSGETTLRPDQVV